MAKKPKPAGKKYSYMDTYGDLVTLLLCFFVLLFAMSTLQEDKYNAFVEALNAQFGSDPAKVSYVDTPTSNPASNPAEDAQTGEEMDPDQTLPADLVQLHAAIQKYIEENGMEGEVSVEQGESGATFIRLSNNLLFGGDSSALRQEALRFLDFLGDCFLSLDEQIWQVRFNGHTASVPGSNTDDWLLSAERAGRVSSYFEKDIGFSPYKIYFAGYGRNYPIGDNETADGRAKNRRVDIVVIGNNSDHLLAALAEASEVYFPDDDTQFFEGPPEELPANAIEDIPPDMTGFDVSGLTKSQIQDYLDQVAAGSNGEENDETASSQSG